MITNRAEKRNHFRWCWYRNIENFEKEGIQFKTTKLYDYFFGFMSEVYYPVTLKDDIQLLHTLKMWQYVFDFKQLKSKSDLDTMIQVYKLFDYTLTTP